MSGGFDYDTAFSRNVGWFSESEQHALRDKTVAIAGCGGVGGIHTLSMARLGVGGFRLADFDHFGLENFNRQIGATMATLEQPKLEVIRTMVEQTNPEARIAEFPEGVTDENAEAFLDGVDLYIDSLDFFAIAPRIKLFALCAEKHIPAITAAPLGMGTAFLCFMPGGMSFEEYFGMEGASEEEQYLRFYLGLAPASLHSAYLVDPSRLDLKNKKGPSTIAGCLMSAGVAATYAVKILLERGELVCAPQGMHWDPYMNRMETTALPGGHRHPEFQQRLIEAKKLFNIA